MSRHDTQGNPLVRVQMIEESGQPIKWQVIDKRRLSNVRVVAEYTQQDLAEIHAVLLRRTP